MGADYLASALGKDAKGPVLVIDGMSGNVTGAKRAHGFAEELKKKAPGLNIVASLPGEWDSLKASDIANDTLQRNPDLVAIFCANDDMALGAVEAARAAGKDKLVVIGVDGTQSALKSIEAGRLNASVAQLPYRCCRRCSGHTRSCSSCLLTPPTRGHSSPKLWPSACQGLRWRS